uniref:Leucine zipper transcription factor-like protein 1 n=1 Tax=Sphenodon punctatus TaxID=8508 RepID=A0A8D0L2C9_SPHPU
RFARSKRGLRLKTVDSCFQDLKDSRLVEETFTVDEVTEMLDGLQTVVHSEVESELINTKEHNCNSLLSVVSSFMILCIYNLFQATSALDEKSKLEKALKDLQMIQGDQKLNTTQDISELEETVAALKCQFEKTLNDSTASQKSLEENLVTTKHDLLKVQDQLSMAEKELEKKFQQTAAYRNMKEILTRKNDQMKELRKRLSK